VLEWRWPIPAGSEGVRVASSERSQELLAEDERLLRAAVQGDRQAFAALVERYWDRLYRWLYHLSGDRHTAEDLAQETFLKAFAHLSRLRPGSNFRAWLFRIAHNSFANQCRSRLRRCPLPDDLADPGSGPVAQVLSREALQGLTGAVNRLPTEFRAALLLRVEGLSFRQIAEVLDLTEETARWRVFKARQKLLGLLTPPAGQESR
jgi:RNA polymerase sigma-70 factor (ECF subfamily)